MPQDAPQLSVLIMHIEDEGPLLRNASPVDAANVREHPAGCGVLSRLSCLAWEGGLGVRESLPETICQGLVDQQAHGHDQQESHAPLGVLQIARGRQQAWVFEKPQATCHMVLALIAC